MPKKDDFKFMKYMMDRTIANISQNNDIFGLAISTKLCTYFIHYFSCFIL